MENSDQDLSLDVSEFLGTDAPEVIPPFQFTEVQIAKLNLGPGEVLAVTIKTDWADESAIQSIKTGLKKVFPDNEVLIFGVGLDDKVEFSTIKQNSEISSCSSGSYCLDCNCGKKQEIEGK